MTVQARKSVARLALTKREAAESIGVSVDSFERHVQPHVPGVFLGRRRVFPVRELERWITEQATTILPTDTPANTLAGPAAPESKAGSAC
jgi:hypothetical protein